MKVYAVISLFLTVITLVSAHHGDDDEHHLETLMKSSVQEGMKTESLLINILDGLLKSVLKVILLKVKRAEPYPIPDLPTQTIEDKNAQVTVALKNVKENRASSLVINSITGSTFSMTEHFDVTLPNLELYGDYVINGKVDALDVEGQGLFHASTTNLHAWGTAHAHLVDGYVQLQTLNIDYTLQNVKASATGLKVQGLSQNEVQELLNEALLAYFTDNRELVCAAISEIVIKEINKELKGMTFTQLVKWLKHIKTSL